MALYRDCQDILSKTAVDCIRISAYIDNQQDKLSTTIQYGVDMKFDAKAFLQGTFQTPPGLVSFLAAYQISVTVAAAEKWFQRGAIPGHWLPIILALIELDDGQPVRLAPYLRAA